MNALCELEISWSMCADNRIDNVFVISFAKEFIKLIGLKICCMFSDVLLRDEDNKRPIEALQRPSTEVVEAVYRNHKVILDDVPASLVKGSSEISIL